MSQPIMAVAGLFLAFNTVAWGGWPGWRGPHGNGSQPEAVPLLSVLPEDGLPLLWKHAPLPGDKAGGFGSPVIKDGRVYQFIAWRKNRAIAERRLARREIERRLGRAATDLPAELLATVELIRCSGELNELRGRQRNDWVSAWMKENLEEGIDGNHRRFIEDRLRRGADALELPVLEKIHAVADTRFSDEAAFSAWIMEAELDEASAAAVRGIVPTSEEYADDTVVCIELESGKTIWSSSFENQATGWGASTTPFVADGRIFAAGAAGAVYCLNAEDGKLLWQTSVGNREINSSPVYYDGRVFIQAGELTALDAASGEVLWRNRDGRGNNASPVLWRRGDDVYILTGGANLACIEPVSGETHWKVSGGHNDVTPTVTGDLVAVQKGSGFQIYRISPDEAIEVGDSAEGKTRGGSMTAHDGRFYVSGAAAALGINGADGTVLWNVKGSEEEFSCAVIADGKLISPARRGGLTVLDAASGETLYTVPGVGALRCTTPALAQGRLLVRTGNALHCYDLRAGQ